MRRPDFIFAGHPRSGSGLINGWLGGHPDLWMATKELHYFGSDLDYNDPPRSLENYLEYFTDAGDVNRVGEASTWYLGSERAAAEIASFDKNMQVIVCLREPVSWLHSLHSHLVFSGNEDIHDFVAALDAESGRRHGAGIPSQCRPSIAVLYRQLVDYTAQVRRFFDALGRQRVHVVLLDDLRDTAEAYRGILEFLEVRSDFEGFEQVVAGTKRTRNTNRTVWSDRVRRYIKQPHRQGVLKGLQRGRPGAQLWYRILRRMNIRYVERPQMSDDLRATLRRELAPEVESLAELIDRDLSAWLPR